MTTMATQLPEEKRRGLHVPEERAVQVLIVGLVLAGKRRREAQFDHRREEAQDARNLASVSRLEADKQAAEAEERLARARRESLAAEQQQLVAQQHRTAAQDLQSHADDIDPDVTEE